MTKYILCIASILMLTSCIEEVDINIDDEYDYIVIDAMVTDIDTVNTVYVYRNGEKSATYEPKLDNVSVEICDQNGNNMTFTDVNNGRRFELHGKHFSAGNTYTLTVKVGERVFQSTQYMAPLMKIKGISFYGHETADDYLYSPIIYVEDDQPEVDNYFMFFDHFFQRFEFEAQNFLYLQCLSDKGMKPDMNGIKISLGIGTSEDQKNAGITGMYYHYRMCSISKENYDYYKVVAEQLTQDGGTYRPFPTTPPTNISGTKVQGQFIASSVHEFCNAD